MFLVNAGATKRLKANKGTHKTLSMVINFESLTMPMCMTGTSRPLGSLTLYKNMVLQIIWSKAPISMI